MAPPEAGAAAEQCLFNPGRLSSKGLCDAVLQWVNSMGSAVRLARLCQAI